MALTKTSPAFVSAQGFKRGMMEDVETMRTHLVRVLTGNMKHLDADTRRCRDALKKLSEVYSLVEDGVLVTEEV